MAIARDTKGVVVGATNTGKTLALTLASDTVLVGACYSEVATVTMTWNSVSMTQIVQVAEPGLSYWLTVFFLGNPASGSHNLVSSHSSVYSDLYGVSYTGANTSNPTSFDNQSSASATTITNTLSTSNNAWFFGVANGDSLSGTVNATQLDTSNATFQADYDSNGIASSTSMTVTRSGSNRIGLASIAIEEATAVTFVPKVMMF